MQSREDSFLKTDMDRLSEKHIRAQLRDEFKYIGLNISDMTGSTNKDAKKACLEGCSHGMTFVSDRQSAGRGRLGRSFLSFAGSGIYMSIVLKPGIDMNNLVYVTTAASVAVVRAVELVTGISLQIKWVNDLYHNGKKVCGILTEAVTDCETGSISSLIVGIGINVRAHYDDIPDELKGIAGALYMSGGPQYGVTGVSDMTGAALTEPASRNTLVAEIINQMLIICDDLDSHTFISEYREKSMLTGCEIYVIRAEGSIRAKVLGIDDRGGLIVRYEDGSENVLITGEVTVRKVDSM